MRRTPVSDDDPKFDADLNDRLVIETVGYVVSDRAFV